MTSFLVTLMLLGTPEQVEPTSTSQAEAAAGAEAKSEPETAAEAEPRSEPESAAEAEPKSEPESETAPEPETVKLVVMPLKASSLQASSVALLDELLTNAVRRAGNYEVIGQSDIDAMLGLENIKDQLGCDDVTCAAEIGGALGAQQLLAGQVARLGQSIIIVLKLIDAEKQQVLASIKHKAADDENTYDEAVESAVRQLFGLEEAPRVAATSSDGTSDMLRSLINPTDYQRYESYVETTGSNITLYEWVDRQNEESTLLFVGELVSGALALVSIGELTGDYDKPIAGGPPVIFTVGFVSLAGLLILDLMDVGAVPVMGM